MSVQGQSGGFGDEGFDLADVQVRQPGVQPVVVAVTEDGRRAGQLFVDDTVGYDENTDLSGTNTLVTSFLAAGTVELLFRPWESRALWQGCSKPTTRYQALIKALGACQPPTELRSQTDSGDVQQRTQTPSIRDVADLLELSPQRAHRVAHQAPQPPPLWEWALRLMDFDTPLLSRLSPEPPPLPDDE